METSQLFLRVLGFSPKENASGIFIKKYGDGYNIEVDFDKKTINYGDKIKGDHKSTQNHSQAENWVILECVNRLLTQGYKPENIILEKTWAAGHGTSGRLDICVTRDDGSEYLLIECKTSGKEFDKELSRMFKDGGQLFTYFKFSNKADVVMLYSSELVEDRIFYKNEIVKIEEDYRTGDVKDFYEKWNKLTKDNGVFDLWVNPYHFESKALTINELIEIKNDDSSFIFNRFLEILRHNVVSDKPNAFNKIFTLFLCKIYDEKTKEGTNEELAFQWKEGMDDNISFQLRLTDLYKAGMSEFLDKNVTDFSEDEFERKFNNLEETTKNALLYEFKRIRLEKNNEFAIKEVYDEKSFKENAKVVKEVVELLQGFKIRYTKKQQYLSDFFEMLLTTGLKQESGQFFTPVPVAQFIIKSLPIDSIVEEKLQKGEGSNLLPYVMDYAAGSGHFLTETMHEVQRLIDKKEDKKYNPSTAKKIRNWKDDHFEWALQYVYGIEKDYRLVKVGKVGCYLHGDGLANVIHSDGLANFKHLDYKGKLRETDKDFPKDNKQFDIVVSNPPYSVSAFKNAARDYYKGTDFDLYGKLTDSSSEIECLFIERTKQLLKDGGVAGIILPSSILSNSGIYTKAREILLEYFDIIGIAELGSNTFMATGTNTVTLFLRRRNNYDSFNLRKAVLKFQNDQLEVTLNGIENPVSKYLSHVWEKIAFEDYKTLLSKKPNKAIAEHEIYLEYQRKIKAKDDKAFWEQVLVRETEKLLYFILAYPQKVVIIKSGEKDAEKRFLGYEFSNRRGSEGIHPIQRGKAIDECTQLFDSEVFDNPEKASTYIYDAFNGNYDRQIAESVGLNVYRQNLIDMLTFDRAEFEKSVSTVLKKKIEIDSKWEIKKLNQLVSIVRGASPRPIKEYTTNDSNGINWIKIGDVKVDSKFITQTKEKITVEGANRSRFVKKGDFILSNSMSFGRPYIMEIEGCIHDGWLLLSDFPKDLNKDYLYYMLSNRVVQDQFISAASGGTSVDNLNIEKVSHTQIPLPPQNIQQQIVSEIEILETEEKKAKAKATNLKKELDRVVSSISANKIKLEDVAIIISGQSPESSNYNNTGSGLPFYQGKLDFGELFIKPPRVWTTQITKESLENDILMSVRAPVGDINVNKIGNICIGRGLCAIRAKEGILQNYLLNILVVLKDEIEAKSNNGATFKAINRENLLNIKIPVPSLSEQQKIVIEIEKIEEKIRALETELSDIPKQKEDILKKYL